MVDLGRRHGAERQPRQRRAGQAEQEGETPPDVAAGRTQQAAGNPADARDATVRQQQHDGRQAGQDTAAERGQRREMGTVDTHGKVLRSDEFARAVCVHKSHQAL